MPKTEHPLSALKNYLPGNSFEQAAFFLQQYNVHLTVTRQRNTILGDYRNAVKGKNHRISINGNLNKFSFLITLLHELAHLLAFEKYGHRILAHGKEWKNVYSDLLKAFINKKIFPADIEAALKQSVQNPAASSCAEEGLMRILRRYDDTAKDTLLLEQLPVRAMFTTKDGRVFVKGERLRKRFRCIEKNSGLVYLFSPIHEVKELAERLINNR